MPPNNFSLNFTLLLLLLRITGYPILVFNLIIYFIKKIKYFTILKIFFFKKKLIFKLKCLTAVAGTFIDLQINFSI